MLKCISGGYDRGLDCSSPCCAIKPHASSCLTCELRRRGHSALLIFNRQAGGRKRGPVQRAHESVNQFVQKERTLRATAARLVADKLGASQVESAFEISKQVVRPSRAGPAAILVEKPKSRTEWTRSRMATTFPLNVSVCCWPAGQLTGAQLPAERVSGSSALIGQQRLSTLTA